jgi:hypothetical protein
MIMKRPAAFLFLLGLAFATTASSGQQAAHAPLRLLLNEIQPAAMASPQYCTLIFDDHHFHSEKADIKRGKEADRKVYEGELSDAEWNSLIAIIDSHEFRDLKVPRTVPPLVMQDTHPYTISVARKSEFQNMEFLDNKSLKPYESQIKPLLQWWKSLRGRRVQESSAPDDPHCALDTTHSVFAQ